QNSGTRQRAHRRRGHPRRAVATRRHLRQVRRRATDPERAGTFGRDGVLRRRGGFEPMSASKAVEVDAPPSSSARERTEAILERFHEEASFDRGHDVRLLARLWPYLHKHQVWLWVALFVVVITAVLSLLTPLIMRDAIDHGVLEGDRSALMRGGLLFA